MLARPLSFLTSSLRTWFSSSGKMSSSSRVLGVTAWRAAVVVAVTDAGKAADLLVVGVAAQSRLDDHATVLEFVFARRRRVLSTAAGLAALARRRRTGVCVARLPNLGPRLRVTRLRRLLVGVEAFHLAVL